MPQHQDDRMGRASAALDRDAALERVGRTRRWMLAGAAALTALLAALASALIPGKSLGAKSHHVAVTPKSSGKPRSSTATPTLPPPAGAAALGLQAGTQSSQGSDSSNSDSSDQGNSGGGNSGGGNSGGGNSGGGNSSAAAAQPAPAPAPAPAPSGNSGAATSGGS